MSLHSKQLFRCSLIFDKWGVAATASCIFKGKVTQACSLCFVLPLSCPTLNFPTTGAAQNHMSTRPAVGNNTFTPLKHKSPVHQGKNKNCHTNKTFRLQCLVSILCLLVS
ncbi:hypothetical protein ILYODFUR_037759 [Ilyodon furcidens]|uniref:Uncharacterized protein n=1 Tax=Ilyodon furcidens TaxID=33524 RepID=A0ABV0T4W9_9TELE